MISNKRAAAAFVDYVLILALASYTIALITWGKMTVSVFTMIVFFTILFLALLFKDRVFKNASLGKRLFKIKVVKKDGSDFTATDALKRTITLILVPIEVNRLIGKNERLGDIWAGTDVVEK